MAGVSDKMILRSRKRVTVDPTEISKLPLVRKYRSPIKKHLKSKALLFPHSDSLLHDTSSLDTNLKSNTIIAMHDPVSNIHNLTSKSGTFPLKATYPLGISKSLSRLVTPLDIKEAEEWLDNLGGSSSLNYINWSKFKTFEPEIFSKRSSIPQHNVTAALNLPSKNSVPSSPPPEPKEPSTESSLSDQISKDVASAVKSSLTQLQTLGYVHVKATPATKALAHQLSLRLLATINRLPGMLNPSAAQILPGGRWQIDVHSEEGAAYLLNGVTQVLTNETSHVTWTNHHPQLLVTLRNAEDQLWHRDFDMFGVCGLLAVRDTLGPQFLPASHTADDFSRFLETEKLANLKDGASLNRIRQFEMAAGDVFVFLPTLVHRGVGTGSLRPMLSTTALARSKRGYLRKPQIPTAQILLDSGVKG
ncbi:hypothetical protein HK096_006294, partial [Nowakowskiella sp. JEL0078]